MLLRSGAPTLLVDQRRPEGTSLTMAVGQRLSGTLIVGAMSVALEDISAVYLRPQDTPCAALDDALLTVAELAAALVLNRPDAMAANTSKPSIMLSTVQMTTTMTWKKVIGPSRNIALASAVICFLAKRSLF